MDKKIIERIAKLKAKADSCEQMGSQEEALAFAAKVQDLLNEYKLSMEEITLAELDLQDPIGNEEVDGDKNRRVKWQETLAQIIARANFCRLLLRSSGDNTVWFVGRESDRKIAAWMFAYLRAEIERQAQRAYVKHFNELRKQGRERQARGFKASFINAFVNALSERYKRAMKAQTARAVVISKQAIDKYVDERYRRKVGNLSGPRGFNADGHEQGYDAGRRANLSNRGVGGSHENLGPRRLNA